MNLDAYVDACFLEIALIVSNLGGKYSIVRSLGGPSCALGGKHSQKATTDGMQHCSFFQISMKHRDVSSI